MKTFIYVLQPKNKGRTTARVYRIKQNCERAHNIETIGLLRFGMSGVPKDEEYKRFVIKKWLIKNKQVSDGEKYYVDQV